MAVASQVLGSPKLWRCSIVFCHLLTSACFRSLVARTRGPREDSGPVAVAMAALSCLCAEF